jgi:hypothetical protein
MRKTNWISTVVVGVSVLGLADVSAAQDTLSGRERAYGSRLAGALDPESDFTVRRVEFAYFEANAVVEEIVAARPETQRAPRPGTPMVKGVAVDMDGLVVERLRFETPEQAQAMAANMLNGDIAGRRPVTGELRGNQLVLVHGDAVTDPERAKEILGQVWDGLPAPKQTDASFTQLEDGSIALRTSIDGPLRDSIDRALAAAHEREAAAQQDPARGTITTTPTTAQVSFPSGFRAGLQADQDGASVYTANAAASEDAMKRHLEALGGHPSRGAVKILQDLFR